LILLEKFFYEHPGKVTQHLESLEDEDVSALIEELPVLTAVKLIDLMNIYKVGKCLKFLKSDLVIELLEKGSINRAELLLRHMDVDFRNRVLDQFNPETSAILRQKLEFPDRSVGAFMIPIEFLIRKDMIVKDVIKALRTRNDTRSSIVCLTDNFGKLSGIVRIEDIASIKRTNDISTLIRTDVPKFFAGLPVDSIANHQGWYQYNSIPVIDQSEKLVGILNFAETQNTMESGREPIRQIMETGSALGEVYRIGLTALLQSVSKGDHIPGESQ
jgi:magnesium transporter